MCEHVACSVLVGDVRVIVFQIFWPTSVQFDPPRFSVCSRKLYRCLILLDLICTLWKTPPLYDPIRRLHRLLPPTTAACFPLLHHTREAQQVACAASTTSVGKSSTTGNCTPRTPAPSWAHHPSPHHHVGNCNLWLHGRSKLPPAKCY